MIINNSSKNLKNYCKACGSRLIKNNPEKCKNCGFIFFSDYEEEFNYELNYNDNSNYNNFEPSKILDHYKNSPNIKWALKKLKILRPNFRNPTLLEIGASQGAFMKLASDYNFIVKGIELSSSSIKYAIRNFNFKNNLELGECRRKEKNEKKVNIVCAFEVLEHCKNPVSFMENIKSWLSPNGFVLISVPNSRRLAVRLGRREIQDYPPHHLMYFNKKSLSYLLRNSGFKVLEVKTSRLTHSDILSALFPNFARKRAASLGSFQPISNKIKDSDKVDLQFSNLYSIITFLGRIIARLIDKIFPELGSRLMIIAKKS